MVCKLDVYVTSIVLKIMERTVTCNIIKRNTVSFHHHKINPVLTLKLSKSKDFRRITLFPAFSTTTNWCIAMGMDSDSTSSIEVGIPVGLYVGVCARNWDVHAIKHSTLSWNRATITGQCRNNRKTSRKWQCVKLKYWGIQCNVMKWQNAPLS